MQEVFERIIKQINIKKDFHKRFLECEGRTEEDKKIHTATQLAFDDAVAIVNSLTAEYNNGWIPCSERLPEGNGNYTVTEEVHSLRTDNRILQTRVVGEVGFADGKWRRANHLKIIAWQPLPQPYEPKED